jgi:hypothetical protein
MPTALQKNVWINKRYEGVWQIPGDYRMLGFSKPHDYVRSELIETYGDVARNWMLIVAPLDGTVETAYPGLERSV